MRFKFCGDLDTPDWVLAKIFLISKLSTSDLKSISNEVLKHEIEAKNEPFEFDRVAKHLESYELKEVDCKGILAALTFILKSAAKYACDHEVLSNELQQLGLHRDGAQLLSRVYQSRLKELRRALEQKSFRVNKLTNVACSLKKELKSGVQCSVPLVEMQLSLESGSKPETKSLLLTPDKLLTLSTELRKIKKTMQRIGSEL